MTNELKEEIEKLIVETDTVTKIDKTTTSRFLPPQFYVDRLVDRFYTLINQKEKELLERVEKFIPEKKDEYPTEDGVPVETYGYEQEYNSAINEVTDRIKQLKEELNKGGE